MGTGYILLCPAMILSSLHSFSLSASSCSWHQIFIQENLQICHVKIKIWDVRAKSLKHWNRYYFSIGNRKNQDVQARHVLLIHCLFLVQMARENIIQISRKRNKTHGVTGRWGGKGPGKTWPLKKCRRFPRSLQL